MDGAPDFFGSAAAIAGLGAAVAADASGVEQRVELAWYLRQRDTRAALHHAEAAEAESDVAALPEPRRERDLGRCRIGPASPTLGGDAAAVGPRASRARPCPI